MNKLEQVLQDFYLDCEGRNLSANTLRYYRDAMKPFLAFVEAQGAKTIEDLTTPMLRAYVAHCLSEVNPGGAHARLRPVRRLMNWCVQEDYLEIDPMRKVKLPKVPEPDVAVIRPAEVRKLLATVQSTSRNPLRDRAMIEVMFSTGLRASEVVGIELRHLSPGAIAVIHGKGRKNREVPVDREVMKTVRLYIARERPDSYLEELFLIDAETPLSVDALKQMVRRMSDAAGLGRRYSPHAFRRGFTVEWLKRGGDTFSAQQMLGHTTQAMTARYARFDTDDLKTLQAKVGVGRSLKKG